MHRPAKDKMTLCRQSVAVAALDVVVCQAAADRGRRLAAKRFGRVAEIRALMRKQISTRRLRAWHSPVS